MSLHALIWLGAFVTFVVLAFVRRSSWGIAPYMMTIYANPAKWWWGAGLLRNLGDRWNLVSALFLLIAVVMDQRHRPKGGWTEMPRVFCLMGLYTLNAAVIHFMLADDPKVSIEGFDNVWKYSVLMVAMSLAIRDRFDLKILIFLIIISSSYVAFEVIFHDIGRYKEGRLEGVPIANCEASNELSLLFSVTLTLGGAAFFCGGKYEKAVMLVGLILCLEVILRCSSRGCLLGLGFGAMTLVVRSRGATRMLAIAGVLLGGGATLAIMSDEHQEKVFGRFMTTFESAENRDDAVTDRLDFWRTGLKMVEDHPLGSGHNSAFDSDLGMSYLRDLGWDRRRSVHNGYIDTAASWGIHGFVLYMLCLFFAWKGLRSTITSLEERKDTTNAFFGCCLEVTLVTMMVISVFGSTLDAEWYVWWLVIVLAYQRFYALPPHHTIQDSVSSSAQMETVPHLK